MLWTEQEWTEDLFKIENPQTIPTPIPKVEGESCQLKVFGKVYLNYHWEWILLTLKMSLWPKYLIRKYYFFFIILYFKARGKKDLFLGKFSPTQIYYDTTGYGNCILVKEITGLPVNTSTWRKGRHVWVGWV